jgi:hypothetical protein
VPLDLYGAIRSGPGSGHRGSALGASGTRIAMMTIKLLLRGRVSSQEILADTEQVRSKVNALGVASGEEWFAETRVNAQ